MVWVDLLHFIFHHLVPPAPPFSSFSSCLCLRAIHCLPTTHTHTHTHKYTRIPAYNAIQYPKTQGVGWFWFGLVRLCWLHSYPFTCSASANLWSLFGHCRNPASNLPFKEREGVLCLSGCCVWVALTLSLLFSVSSAFCFHSSIQKKQHSLALGCPCCSQLAPTPN